MRWIVGLGNPGKRYAATRHNVGFQVLDRFAARHGFGPFVRFSPPRSGGAEALLSSGPFGPAGGEKVFLLKPQTFMNLSGPAVRAALDFYGGEPSQLLVVHDDLDLPLGKLRYRARGSSGGHRGLESLLEALGTSEFARLKVGIGRPEGKEAASYVLEETGPEERPVLERAVDQAAESLEVWIGEGVEQAALRYNRPEPGTAKGTA